jgi:hypothetical protein
MTLTAKNRNRSINRKWDSKMKGSKMADRIIRDVDNGLTTQFTHEVINTSPLSYDVLKEIAELRGMDQYSHYLSRLNVRDYETFVELDATLTQTYLNNHSYSASEEVQFPIRFLLRKLWDWMEAYICAEMASDLDDMLNVSQIDREVLEDYNPEVEWMF